MLRRSLLLALTALLVSGGAAAPSGSLSRATFDRVDDRGGPQVHIVYVVPSDGIDRQLDINGKLAGSVAVWEQWFVQQTGGRLLRLDTFEGSADITFLRRPHPSPLQFYEDLAAVGMSNPQKVYAVYYDAPTGLSSPRCGEAGLGSRFAIAFLLEPGCATAFQGPGQPLGHVEFVMAHEVLHALGFVPSCAPHWAPFPNSSHVTDSSLDLMAIRPSSTPALTKLDAGRDDYFEADIPGCRDLADSPYLAPEPPGPLVGVTAVGGDGEATVSFAPAASPPVPTSYTVVSSPEGRTATGTSSPLTITGLTNGTPYTFYAIARNGTEFGMPVPSNEVTPLGRPGPPSDVVAVAGDGHASVTFTPPSVTGGAPPIWYTVTAWPSGQSSSGLIAPITVYGLTNGADYQFTVTATNVAGIGENSAPSDVVTPEAEPRPHAEPTPPGSARPPVPEFQAPAAPRPPPPPR